MSPPTPAQTELRLAIANAEKLSAKARQRLAEGAREDHTLSDLATDVTGHLADALNNIDPGLGSRLMVLMHPHLKYSLHAYELDAAANEQAAANPEGLRHAR
jgi:hypothetical protein